MITAVVAAASFGLALNSGGYSSGFIAGASLLLWWAVLVCLGLRLLPRSEVPLAAIASGAALALLAAWTGLSWLWASDDGAVVVEIVRVLSYLGLFVLVVIVCGREGARPWLAGLALGLSAVVLLALVSRFEPSLGDTGLTGSRLSYPLGYWNALGACAALALTLLAWHAGHARTHLARVLSTAALPLPALAIFLSASRGGLGAALLGVVLVVAFGPRREALIGGLALGALGSLPPVLLANSRSALLDGLTGSTAAAQGHELLLATVVSVVAIGYLRHRADQLMMESRLPAGARRLGQAVAIAALVALVVAENPVERFERFKEPPQRVDRLITGAHFRSDNGSGRYQFWGAALDALGEQPLHGIGAGQYETWWNQNGSISWILRDAHSLLFETAAELGLVGLALLLAFLALPVRSGWRRRGASSAAEIGALLAVLGAGILSASIDWLWELPAAFAPVVVALALLSGPATLARAGPRSAEDRPLRGNRRLVAAAATMLIAWGAIWLSGDLLLTRIELDKVGPAIADGELEQAREAANDAVALQPWAAEPRFQLGLVEEAAGDYGAASDALRDAVERAPEDWRIRLILGRVEAEAGRTAAARAARAEARRLNPRSPLFSEGEG